MTTPHRAGSYLQSSNHKHHQAEGGGVGASLSVYDTVYETLATSAEFNYEEPRDRAHRRLREP